MADIQSNIEINIDTSQALSSIKLLQSQISAFNTQMSKSGAAANAAAANMQQNLINSINQTGKFTAQMKTIKTTTESFTTALQTNQLSMKEYFRYAGASTKTFGKLFKTEFDTISKVSRERVKDIQTQYIKMGRDASGAMKAIAVRPLALDMDSLATKTAMAAQKQALLNQLLRQGSTNLLNFGKNTQWAGRQLMVGFTVPLTMLGTAAAKTFMQLEEQAIKFKRVYGDLMTSNAETNSMLKEIELLAKGFTKYGVAVADTMGIAAQAAATGKMGADLIQSVANATKLAVLGGVDQSAALETTISLTNAFGIAADKLSGKIDFLNAVENQTVVSIEDLTTAIPKAGPVVQQLGGNVEDLAFFLTAMKEGGINASEGANALKSGLAALINPTKSASNMLAAFGINIKGIVEANKGDVKGTVISFAQALDTLDPLNRARAIEQLFGKFQFARISTLFKNVIAQGSQASKVLELTKATSEELAILSERELNKVQNTTTYKFKKTIEDLKVSVAPIGEQFLKAITPVIEFVGKILNAFSGLSDGTKKWVVLITSLLAGIGPIFLMTVGLIANGAANIIKLFVAIKSVFNRAGTASTDLGAQTQYMTTQQMEAAAVASSLEQVHSKLTQAFSSEASAVNQLVAAYQRAVIAQRSFTGPIGMPMPNAPKKMAVGGIIRGAGTGTSDSIPAMVSNGEAIIPAANVKKYPGIVAGLVAGNIPGFMSGTVSVANKPQGLDFARQSTAAKIQSLIDGSLGQIDDVIATALQNLSSQTRVSLEKFKAEVRAQAEAMGTAVPPSFASSDYATRTKSYNARGAGERRTLPVQLTEERGSQAAAAELERANAAAKAISNEMEKYGATAKEITAATQIDRAHVVELTNEQKLLKDAWSSDIWVAQTGAENNLSNSLKSSSRNRAVYLDYLEKSNADQEIISSITDKVTKGIGLNEQELQVQGNVLRNISQDMDSNIIAANTVSSKFKMYAAAVAAGATARETTTITQGPDIVKQTERTQSEINRGLTKIANELPKAAAEALQVRSPSKKMEVIGEQSGKGALIGFEKYIDDMRIAGEKMGAAGVKGTMSQSQLAAASKANLYGTGPIDANAKSVRRQLERQQNLKSIQDQRKYLENEIDRNKKTTGSNDVKPGKFSSIRGKMAKIGTPSAGGLARVGMGATAAMSIASMMPGAAGDAAGKLIGPMMALTTILPMLTSGFGALAVGLGAIAFAVYSSRRAFDKAQDSALALGESLGTTNSMMKKFGEATGEVSATEIMDRRRQSKFGMYGIQTGKPTFGQSFVQSDTGKEMLKNVTDSVKTIGNVKTQGMVTNQLMTAVASGSMTAAQARSVAANIGESLGDYNFAINVNAKLAELIGPNGENLLSDPLGVRIKMIEEARGGVNQSSTIANRSGKVIGKDVKNIGGYAAAGAGLGAAGGAIAGGMVGGPLGAAIGAVAGTIVGSIGGAIMGYKDRGKRIGAATGASIAMDKMALEQNQQLIDSFDLQYQGKIELLKTQGKMNEAVALENKYYAERDKLLGATNQTKQQILNNYMSTSGDVRSAYNTGTDKSITATYKDTPMADIATQAVQMLNDSKMGDRTKQNLKIELSTKGVDPLTMVNLLSTFTNPGDIEKVVTVIDKFGGKFGGEAINTIQGFVDKDGKPLTNLQTNYMIAIGTKTTQEAEKFQNFFITLTKMKAVIPAAVSVSYFMDPANKTALDDSMLALDKIQALSIKEKLKVKVVADIINDPKAFDILNSQASEFDKLPPEQQKVFASVLETFLTTSGTPEAQKQMEAWRKEFPGKTDVEIISTKINQLVKAQTDFTTGVTSATTPTTTGNRNPWAFLDDVVKQLRDTRDAAIDAAKPLQVLKDLMSGKLKLEAFGGLTDKFRSITMAATGAKGKLETVKDLNPNENLLSALQGLDPKDFKTISKALFTKNKAGDITGFSKKGLAVNQIFDEAQVGKYTDSLAKQNVEILNQQKAYMKLTVAGVSASQALEITGDAALAASIASENIKVGTTEWDLFIANVQKAKDLLKTNEQFKIGKAISAGDYTTAFSSGYDAIQKIFNIQERLIALKYKGDRDLAANAVKAAETEIAANSYKISRYQYGLDLINTKADEITQKYNDQFAALDKIRSVNDAITQQKQTQIDLASSLSRGDISSAAKAMETLRQQRANSAMENARKAMENQRDSQINALTDANGLTKVQLEEKIKQLSDANKKIQYETVDVKNEVIRLIDLQIEKENSSLTVAGKTKDAWDALAIKVDAAEVATGKFDTAIAGALTTATALELKWKDIAKAFDAYQQITAGVSTEQKAITGQVGTSKTLDTKTVVDKTVVPTSTVVVKSGDTLSAIAKKAGVSLSTLIKANPQIANPNLIKPKQVINLPAIAKSEGGMVPSYFAAGGYGKGTDTIPAMLTPGEFVVKKYSVDNFGVDNLKAINNGTYNGNSVYNYNLSVNVGGLNTSADDIARTVMSEIRRNESQRVRGIK